MKQRLSAQTYVERIRSGDRIVLSQAITLIESTLPADQELAQGILAQCEGLGRSSFRLGITGPPGVGKSTFIDALGSHLTGMGQKVAVLTIDPSSPKSGGSILGDKTRMVRLSKDPSAYIRPSATGGTLGGVANTTRETIALCEAAGYPWILVETVGVGQSETWVHALVDCFLLMHFPQGGDQLQGIKRGIMEMAHMFVINKADGALKAMAETSGMELRQALSLFQPQPGGWEVPVLLASAQTGEGMGEIMEQLAKFRTHQEAEAMWQARRREQQEFWLEQMIKARLWSDFLQTKADRYAALKEALVAGKMSLRKAVARLLDGREESGSTGAE